MNEQQLREWREFADHMGSDISVLSIQYKLAKMVWSLCDEVTRLNEENTALSAKLERVPVDAIRAIYDSVPVNNWTRKPLAAIRKWLAALGKQVSL